MPSPQTIEEEALLAVLEAFGQVPELRERFVFKGGNALRWVYEGPRASVDLDFSAVERFSAQDEAESRAMLDEVTALLAPALERVRPLHRFEALVVQSARVLPPNRATRQFPALEVKVGYSRQPGRTPPFPTAVKMEITLNEVVCEFGEWRSGRLRVRVGTLEEIVAEKLRALLQQERRRRFRSSDVFDIWFFSTRARSRLDPAKIAEYLLAKSEGRDSVGPVSKARFDAEEMRRRAEQDYAAVGNRLLGGEALPPFEEAYAAVRELVADLAIP